MKVTRLRIAVVTSALVGAALFVMARARAPLPPQEMREAQPVSAAPPTTVTEMAAQGPVIALRDRYQLEYKMKMTHAGSVTLFTLKGVLDVSRPLDTGSDVRMAVLSDLSVVATGQQIADQLSQTASYTAPLKLRFRTDGGLSDIVFSSETPQSVRGTLFQIASLCQLTQASSKDALQWAATESDPNATYTARYQRRNPRLITKTFGAKATQNSIDVYDAEGEARFELGSDAIETVRASFVQHIRISRTPIEASVELVLTRPAGQAVATMSAERSEALMSQVSQFAPFEPEHLPTPSQADKDRLRVAGRSFERIVDDITKADETQNWQLRKSYGFDLAALARLEPKTVPLIVSAAGRETREPVRRTLIESLANARTTTAQQGLTQMMKDPSVPNEAANQARSVSAFVERPVDELLDQLTADSESENYQTRRVSIMALGSMLGSRAEKGVDDKRLLAFIDRGRSVLKEHGIEDAELTLNSDGALLADPKKKRATRTALEWLQALGSTHAREVLPLLAAATRSHDHAVRAEAVLAIRGIKGKEPAALIAERALKDPIYYVRHHAVTTLGDLGSELGLETVKHVLTKDPEASVRAQAAFTIGRWAVVETGLKTLLSDALEHEEEDVVINAILDVTVPGRGYQYGQPQRIVLGGASQ